MTKMKSFLAVAFMILSVTLFAQLPPGFGGGGAAEKEHITFSTKVSKTDVTVGEVIEVTLNAKIDAGWKLYTFGYDCPPLKFEAKFVPSDVYELVGKIKAVNDHAKDDDLFGCTYRYFEKSGQFKQKIKIKKSGIIQIGLFGQVCQADGVCMMVEGTQKTPFIKASEKVDNSNTGTTENVTGTKEEVVTPKVEVVENTKEKVLTTDSSNCCCDQEAILKKIDGVDKKVNAIPAVKAAAAGSGEKIKCDLPRQAGWDDIEISNLKQGEAGNDSIADLWLFFGGAFVAGLLALLTPCVFPIIPMTVTFFTKQSKTKAQGIRNALFYGISIILIYTTLGLASSKLLGSDFLNSLATSWLNVVFFAIFVIFAISFLGAFEITLPSSLVNKMDKQSERGGLMGIFFMAFTLSLVTFSCTGPLVGSVLLLSEGGQWLKPIFGMLGFSTALALPFMLFAFFPGWLQSMPKSGGWLNVVKVTLGLLELAFAFKFLSNADLAYHWHILDREIFLAIWIVLFAVLGIYLLGKLRFPNDSPVETLGVGRFLFALVPLIFVVYLLPGMWGAPLKAFSGILPPRHTQDFDIQRIVGDGNKKEEYAGVMYGEHLKLPHNLQGYFDFRQAICKAKNTNKPIFVDFTGHGCANCRMMEEGAWSNPENLNLLNNDFVIASLYVDDRKLVLPEGEAYTAKSGKQVTLMGEANFDLEATKFFSRAQPHYFILAYDHEKSKEGKIVLELLEVSEGFSETSVFTDFLQKGKKGYVKWVKQANQQVHIKK